MSTNSPSALDFETWRQCILAAAIKDPTSSTEHNWICYTYNNEKRERLISVLPPEKYRELSSKNSFWQGKQCEKMPLTEIIAITQRLATPKIEDVYISELTFSLRGRVSKLYMGDAFSSDMQVEALVPAWLLDWEQKKTMKEAEISEVAHFIKALENMCLRSQAKREALKATGLWGWFLLFIHSLFNKIPETKNLRIDSPKKQPEHDLPIPEIKKKLCKLAENKIKERIVNNMEDFEENFLEDLRREEYKNKNWNEAIQHPNDVKKKWLAFYAEDKISKEKVSEIGNEQRVRIQTLTKLWEDFKKYSESIVNEPPSNSMEPSSGQPQLLQPPQ